MLAKFFRKKRKLPYSFAQSKSSILRKRPKPLPASPPITRPRTTLANLSRKSSKLSRTFKLALFTIIFLTSIYAVFFSNFFEISKISLAEDNFGNQTLNEEIKKSLKAALNKNLIFFETQAAELKILNSFPQLETVAVEKNYPNTLTIKFAEYPLSANIINESNNLRKNYIINSIGYIIKEDFEDPNLPYIRIQSDEPINPENPVIENTKLKYILEVIPYYQDKFGMKIVEAQYKPTPRELHLLTERQFFIWLDIQNSFENQLKKLKKALVKLDIYKENLAYIDLRIAGNNGDKIIYKRK